MWSDQVRHDDVEGAQSDCKLCLTPAPEDLVSLWLAELDAVTAKPRGSQESAAVRLNAYVSRLQQYPADVVKHVLHGVVWKFFPTWAELHEICEEMTAPRRAILSAVSKPLPALESKEPEETQEEAQARRERGAELVRAFLRKAKMNEAGNGPEKDASRASSG